MEKFKSHLLWAAMTRVQCFYLMDYHKYWIDKVARTKNENFTRENGLILSLKRGPTNPDFNRAVSYFSAQLSGQLSKLPGDGYVEVLIVPSCTAGNVSIGLEKVISNVAKADKRFRYHANTLVRTKTIDKLAHGGDRSVLVHMNSISYRPRIPLHRVLLLDDVCTTGNSLIACYNLVSAQHPGAPVFAVTLGRTVDD